MNTPYWLSVLELQSIFHRNHSSAPANPDSAHGGEEQLLVVNIFSWINYRFANFTNDHFALTWSINDMCEIQ